MKYGTKIYLPFNNRSWINNSAEELWFECFCCALDRWFKSHKNCLLCAAWSI